MAEPQPERVKDRVEEKISIEELPMNSFKGLARRLLKITRDEVIEQERLHNVKRQEKKNG